MCLVTHKDKHMHSLQNEAMRGSIGEAGEITGQQPEQHSRTYASADQSYIFFSTKHLIQTGSATN